LRLVPQTSKRFTWLQDEDGDICNITSDFELAFVLQGREAKGAYTVFVSRIDCQSKPDESSGLQVPGHIALPPLSSDESTVLHKQRMLLLRAADMQRLASEYARQAAECQSQSANYQQQASDLMAAAAALVSKPQ
jgi:hypothetical protein